MKTIVQLVSELKDYFLNKDTEAKQAVEANIAPVEINALSSSSAYAVGAQLILNDVLYDVTSSISVGDAITVGTNVIPASKLSANIKSKQDQIEVSTMPTASASNVGKVYIYIGATTSSFTSGHSYQSTLESGSYVWKDVSGGSPSAEDVSYDGTSSDLEATNVQGAIDELQDKKQDQIEVSTMPTASASNVGKVYIYIGATTSSFTSGHSYQSTLESGSYVWKDVSGGSPSAEDVSYDGTSSDLEATNVQGAIDELHNNIGSVVSAELQASITTVSFNVPTTGNHLIDFWISDGSAFTQIDTSTSGRVTLTFNASAIDRTVSMRIANI